MAELIRHQREIEIINVASRTQTISGQFRMHTIPNLIRTNKNKKRISIEQPCCYDLSNNGILQNIHNTSSGLLHRHTLHRTPTKTSHVTLPIFNTKPRCMSRDNRFLYMMNISYEDQFLELKQLIKSRRHKLSNQTQMKKVTFMV